ncbi:MAG: hypothetical protein H0V61_06625 [Chitinophagales bacterium]|nr:hypothetical protein [Chitinophagales bacterium]
MELCSDRVYHSLIDNIGPLCWARGNWIGGTLYRRVGVNVYPGNIPGNLYGNHQPRIGQSYVTISQLHSYNGLNLSDSSGDYRGMLQCRLLKPLHAGETYKFPCG